MAISKNRVKFGGISRFSKKTKILIILLLVVALSAAAYFAYSKYTNNLDSNAAGSSYTTLYSGKGSRKGFKIEACKRTLKEWPSNVVYINIKYTIPSSKYAGYSRYKMKKYPVSKDVPRSDYYSWRASEDTTWQSKRYNFSETTMRGTYDYILPYIVTKKRTTIKPSKYVQTRDLKKCGPSSISLGGKGGLNLENYRVTEKWDRIYTGSGKYAGYRIYACKNTWKEQGKTHYPVNFLFDIPKTSSTQAAKFTSTSIALGNGVNPNWPLDTSKDWQNGELSFTATYIPNGANANVAKYKAALITPKGQQFASTEMSYSSLGNC